MLQCYDVTIGMSLVSTTPDFATAQIQGIWLMLGNLSESKSFESYWNIIVVQSFISVEIRLHSMVYPNIFPQALLVIPKELNLILIFGLIFAVFVQIRQGHIGRPGIVANSFIVIEMFAPHWDRLPEAAQIYLYGALVFGVIAAISYASKESLPTEFYKMAFILYSSLSILMILWLMAISAIPIF